MYQETHGIVVVIWKSSHVLTSSIYLDVVFTGLHKHLIQMIDVRVYD